MNEKVSHVHFIPFSLIILYFFSYSVTLFSLFLALSSSFIFAHSFVIPLILPYFVLFSRCFPNSFLSFLSFSHNSLIRFQILPCCLTSLIFSYFLLFFYIFSYSLADFHILSHFFSFSDCFPPTLFFLHFSPVSYME